MSVKEADDIHRSTLKNLKCPIWHLQALNGNVCCFLMTLPLPNNSSTGTLKYCIMEKKDLPSLHSQCHCCWWPVAHPTYDISMEFEIQWNSVVLLLITYILLITTKFCTCYCRDVCKISLWSVEQILNQSSAIFYRISNSIKILLVGRAPSSVHHGNATFNGETKDVG